MDAWRLLQTWHFGFRMLLEQPRDLFSIGKGMALTVLFIFGFVVVLFSKESPVVQADLGLLL